MKPHLPLLLLSAIIFSHSSVMAAAPGADAIDLTFGEALLEGPGDQSGAITGNGNLIIESGTVTIGNATGENSYTGDTTIKAGATLSIKNWTGASATEYKQFGTSTLLLSGTLNIDSKDKNPANRLLSNNITFSDGASIRAGDNGINFGGEITLASGTANMVMSWGNEWVFSGKKTGAGTFSFGGSPEGENQLFVLRGDNETFSGTYQLTNGKSGLILENSNAAKGAHVVLGNADSYLVLKNIDATIGGLTGNGIVRNGVLTRGGYGTFTQGAEAKTLTIEQTNAGEDIFSGTIENNVNLTKAGVGTLTLTNLAGYTGNLGVQGGILSLKLGADSIYDLAKVTGTGGGLRLESGNFSISGNSIGTVDLGGATLSANGTTLVMDVTAAGSDKISFTGALSGELNIQLNFSGVTSGLFTLFSTDSNANAEASIGSLRAISRFYAGKFETNGVNINFNLTGYNLTMLKWTGGAEGTWSNGSTTWVTPDDVIASFDSTEEQKKSAYFGEQVGTANASITLAASGIIAKEVIVESELTNYTFTGGALKADLFTKDGASAVVIDLAYDIPQFDINAGSVELKRSSSNDLIINGKGVLNVNWGNDDATVTNVNLSGHSGGLTLTSGSIRTDVAGITNELSVTMAGGSLYLKDEGNIDLALKGISVSGTDSKIIRDSAGNIAWNTALTGDGQLTFDLDGTLNLSNGANFTSFEGTLAVNGNISINGTITFKAGGGLILGEGKMLEIGYFNTMTGGGIVTLSKNTTVTMGHGTLSPSEIALAAEGGDVTFLGFTQGPGYLSGKITGIANQLIFNHNVHGNALIHSNWDGSNYLGTTIFKATAGSGSTHEYQVKSDSAGAITPWGNAANLVQIGTLDTASETNIKFSGLAADGSVSIGNAIELITGSVADKNSTLEFTSGSYDLTGKVSITNGAEGANKSIIKSSGADITLSGGLSGDGPLDIDMVLGKTLLLSGSSDYTGTLSVVNGILSLGTDFATGTIQVNTNGILTASGNGSVSNLILNGGAISLTGTDNLSVKSLVDDSATKGIITVAGTSSITFTDALIVENKITGTGSVKINAGEGKTVSLTVANDYSGGTQITSGTAQAGNASSFGSSTISVLGTGILDMNNVALGNALSMEGSSQLKNAGAYAGAEASAILKDMTGNLSLGGLNANKIASISTKIVDAVNGATLKDIGGSSMKLGSSSLAVGVNNLYASVDINNPNKPYPGSSEAILQFSNSGAIVEMIQNATLTLNLEDADLVAKMQAMQSVGSQTFQLLITNGSLSKGLGSIDFTGLEADFKLVQIDGGNVIVSGDLSNIYALASGQTRTISDGTFFNPFLQVLVNGTLTLEGTAQDNVVLKNLAGKQSGIINITDVGSVTLNVADADKTATYEGKLTGTNTTLIKTGEGKQELLGGLDFADSKVELQEGALVLGGTSTVGTLIAETGTLDLTKDSTLNLTGADSTLSGDVTLSGEGSLVVAPTGTLSLTENAKLDGVKLTLDGGNLDLGATTDSKVSALSGNGTLTMAAGALNIAGKAGQTSIFNGSLAGAGKIQVSGEGTQELVGAGNGAYDLDVTGGSLILRGDAGSGLTEYNSLSVATGTHVAIGTIGTDKTAPMTRLTLTDGGTVNSGGTLSFIYNTNLDNALTSGPLLTTGGLLDIQSGSIIDVTTLDNSLEGASELGGNDLSLVLATKTGNGSITLGDGVNLKTGGLFKTLFDQTQLQLDDAGNLVFKGTVRIENLFNQAVTSANTATASDLLWKNRYIDAGSELGKLIAFLGDAISAGDLAEANHAMAASVGSTVTSLHAAQKDDFYKQQMWVRNRVTQMGVNPDYFNEDMPYVNMWMQANSSYDKLNTSGDESGYKLTTWGGTVGFDVNTSEAWTFGGAFTASYGNLTAKAADTAKGDFDTYYANLFARMQVGKWSHSLIVSGGWNDMSLNRNVSYAENSYATRGTTNGSSYGAMYEATYDVAMGKAGKSVFQPLFNASIQKSKVDSYSETGAGNAGLDVSGMDSTTGTMGVGARLMGMVGSNLFGREVLGELRAMVVQDLGDRRSSATVGFLNDISYKNQVRGVKAGSTGAQLGGSLVIPVGMQNSSIYVDVNADLRSKATSINGNIGYRYSF